MERVTGATPTFRVQRQQLLRLTPEGWNQVLAAPWDDSLRPCLSHWAANGHPLVVTRQLPPGDDGISTGLPAPACWQRRRLSMSVTLGQVLFFDEFPAAEVIARALPRPSIPSWRALLSSIAKAGCKPRVYGGYGWQALTRLAYVHAASDIDLLLPVVSASQADEVVALLSRFSWAGPRLDGEVLFPDGGAVAWREWSAWRNGRATQVLVKRLHGVALETPSAEIA